ncbi:molybdenum ABC transporter, periplasmic molybdate-binding protein [Methanolobus tindarius DSM 2278]|jgi:molybdate transport system substrate-binding protein|uniref:Molybdenum ABC transporter, periplasmic molybdate-binding protein n=1 Tax=Methanolobus tindarius DSM 2278 TaxID=1090322 RepID=W9DTR1_METTI|nr:molybdate ABC transporter substrate-binding protein [Methanolobus tindarius]ETA69183.1 molybdenum ABC transporter, periplasmic molybdate-binding protein [Methanolobus tindarius DSM 2278]
MVNKKHIIVFLLLISCILFLGCVDSTSDSVGDQDESVPDSGNLGEQVSEETLLVYCGAGMRKPMDEIGVLFEEEYGVPVQYNYAGSNTLLTQIELTGEGDVYMPGATYYFEVAAEKGFVDNSSNVAYHVPVIITPLDNPANIDSLDDLANDDVSVVLGDPQAAAIGVLCDKMLTKKGIYNQTEDNVVSRGATVNELVTYITLGQADASIVWEDLVRNNDAVNVIEIAEDDNIIKIVPIATLTTSENPEIAAEFVDFVVSDEGHSIFEEYGFTLYPDEKYAYLDAN